MVPPVLALFLSTAAGAVAVPTAVAPPLPTTTSTTHCYLHVTANAGDSCASIAAVFNLDVAAFRRMNPGIDCAQHLKGTFCVADGSSGGVETSETSLPSSPSSSSSPPSPSSPSSSAVPPSPRQSSITPQCRAWHKVAAGDTCNNVESTFRVSDTNFRAWNGFLDADCTNLWKDYYCCVGVL
ncbi:uncharacterized protein SPSK_01997 [Sporothrix schenckii 1099-18]|uniref:LysM domain-containing protein n=2 Tax=Sporothrix schenckii TaxID=29908 RepID=U7PLQ0_SPOS1|nr:uncharacterized protein SPSK_01997 [Sporothrix schenckii 1099-18]ERS95415.1 hypothetical protein HMPREF1624_08293 [Sporothrix schenckii ATCC 58251]KJR87459.1 hypothetical protein SPSK_01997 [Sporothrix schenckii 1099-18]